MSPNAKFASDLQKLLDLEPSLVQELETADDLNQALEHITAAAGRHHISLEPGELARILQAVDANAATGELTDGQLAGVNGGKNVHEHIQHNILKLLSAFGIRFP